MTVLQITLGNGCNVPWEAFAVVWEYKRPLGSLTLSHLASAGLFLFCWWWISPPFPRFLLPLGTHQFLQVHSVQFSSAAQSCPTLCDPMNCSTPGLPVHHQLLEFTQTHIHRVSDSIQPSHPMSSLSPPAPNPSQHQSLFQWVNSVSSLASFLPKKSQGWSSEWTGWISLQSKELSRVFSNTTVQKHQVFGAQLSSQSNSHIHTGPQEKP